jgi:hypothetical protein
MYRCAALLTTGPDQKPALPSILASLSNERKSIITVTAQHMAGYVQNQSITVVADIAAQLCKPTEFSS